LAKIGGTSGSRQTGTARRFRKAERRSLVGFAGFCDRPLCLSAPALVAFAFSFNLGV
jgi:hypothetical protein